MWWSQILRSFPPFFRYCNCENNYCYYQFHQQGHLHSYLPCCRLVSPYSFSVREKLSRQSIVCLFLGPTGEVASCCIWPSFLASFLVRFCYKPFHEVRTYLLPGTPKTHGVCVPSNTLIHRCGLRHAIHSPVYSALCLYHYRLWIAHSRQCVTMRTFRVKAITAGHWRCWRSINLPGGLQTITSIVDDVDWIINSSINCHTMAKVV